MPAIQPIIAIKAGKCNQEGTTVMPCPEPGLLYVYLHPDEGLHHLCWKPRGAVEPEIDLLMIPGDARLVPINPNNTGRFFVLKFSSSSQRNFYWLQAQSEDPENLAHWSERDKSWIRRIDNILRGEEEDEEMGDAPINSSEIEQEGSQPRRDGEDGARAAPPQIDFASLLSQIQVPGGQAMQQAPSLSLHDLLSSANTTPLVEKMSEKTIDSLISNLPPALVPTNASLSQKKQIITKVLRSPQFAQGAVSLTVALREGALRGVADSLKVPILPGEEASGDPVGVFVKGIKREVEKEGEN
ncbi:proteasome complex subunit Rpn13 ubiquitin receptor-domain-containing protein [Sphaerosporella brunnea]|uniref:Proteasome complex subunit Rpn13 ubiquitin receptor-domain-containing protein n=1 Tax=Sphaerosporella brunnea TaxID=1250544 RepID=A0A5J5EN75_9PEZI|nr:proteasome complex subunit Rpn13 ubiquitin receptor-domain-containing protein [Sphaerosporella brunnea]